MCSFVPRNFILVSSVRPGGVLYRRYHDTLHLIIFWLSHGVSIRDPPLLVTQVNPVYEFTHYYEQISSEVWGKTRMEYNRKMRATTNDFQAKIKNESNQPSRWSSSTDAPSSCGRSDVQTKSIGSVPTRLAEHVLPPQERRCLEA